MEDQASDFAFVAWEESEKIKSVDRKLIRRHCMRGKNRRDPVEQPIAQWLGHDSLNPSDRPLLLSFSLSHVDDTKNHDKRKDPIVLHSTTSRRKRSILTPQKVRSETVGSNTMSFPIRNPPLLTFADDLDRGSLDLLFTVFPGVLRSYSLVEFGLRGDLKSSQWGDWLFKDVAYVHSAITVSMVVRSLLLKREPPEMSSSHLRKAISQLNMNLSDESTCLSDINIAVIIVLCMASCIGQDHASTLAHGNGLRELVRLRGGLDSFHGNPQLQVGMTRVDLCISLGSGHIPIFTTSPSHFASGSKKMHLGTCDQQSVIPEFQYINHLVDHRVATIFQDFRGLAQRLNNATSGQGLMLASHFHAVAMSIQYRLFNLHNKLNDITSEWVRVTLLASLTTTFQVMGSRIKYEHLAQRLRELCRAVEVSTEELRHVMFWALMVGAIALFDSEEQWLREKWRLDVLPLTLGLHWDDGRQLLEKCVWINACNDVAGSTFFNEMMRDLGNGRSQ